MSVSNKPGAERASADFELPLSSAVLPPATARASKSFAGMARPKTMRKISGAWGRRIFLSVMLAGSLLISAMSLPYFDFETLPPFVIEKLPLRFETLWLASLRVHVAAAALGFPLCLALMTRALQRRTAWHRWLGRFTGLLLLCALLPSGIVLAFDAKGGRPVTAGFLLSALIVGGAMIIGVRAARRRDLVLHARALRHVVGQMSVAVVSRALIVGLDALGVDPDLAYVAALWGPVLASAAVVELISRRAPLWQHKFDLVERMRRELSPFSLVLRVRAFLRPLARFGR